MSARVDEPSRQRPERPVVVLASASPRRAELVSRLGIDPVVTPADVDETTLPGESPVDYVLRVSTDKAHAVSRSIGSAGSADAGAAGPGGSIVVAADTSVVIDGDVLGKPSDGADAAAMLHRLSGRTHDVLTGVVVVDRDGIEHGLVATAEVTLVALSTEEINWYVSTGEPMGKAGAYAIQGVGEFMVERIDGAPSTVIGLPLRQTIELLRLAGLDWPAAGPMHP